VWEAYPSGVATLVPVQSRDDEDAVVQEEEPLSDTDASPSAIQSRSRCAFFVLHSADAVD
jgi:hypothetical protein